MSKESQVPEAQMVLDEWKEEGLSEADQLAHAELQKELSADREKILGRDAVKLATTGDGRVMTSGEIDPDNNTGPYDNPGGHGGRY
jgi:hypothetical protein